MTETQITIRLVRKNQFTFHLKSGAKIVEKFISVSGKWANTCQVFETIEDAVRFYVESAESLSDSFGKSIKITVEL